MSLKRKIYKVKLKIEFEHECEVEAVSESAACELALDDAMDHY
ncbi:hypothetical protein [Pleionea sp. CnH1-48]|nr:hypothetical protein [Pleionea sp. CnH1-48]